MLIVLEGIDGCGKSTQAGLLRGRVKAEFGRYPDREGAFGPLFKKVLAGSIGVGNEALFTMFLMDMAKDAKWIGSAARSTEKNVILDRYYHSTLAYQCAQGLEYARGKEIVEWFDLPMPDLVVVIDVKPDVALARIEGGEVFERAEFLARVRENYDRMVEESFGAKKIVKIDGSGAPERVLEHILKQIK